MNKRTDFDASAMASAVMWTFIVMILGTVLGVWTKFFVIGWVLDGVVCR